MRNFWKTDACYAKNGVDGSNCSIRVYLSEVCVFCYNLLQLATSFALNCYHVFLNFVLELHTCKTITITNNDN